MIPTDALETELYKTLSSRYGEMIGGDKLRLVLGFSSLSALCQAISRDTLGLPVFHVTGRRGRFALTIDVADWLTTKRQAAKLHASKPIPIQFQSKTNQATVKG